MKHIANRRINRLLSLARKEKDERLAKRYVSLARKIAMRTRTRLGKRKYLFCPRCNAPLKPGKVRLVRGVRKVVCEKCGYVRNIPYKA